MTVTVVPYEIDAIAPEAELALAIGVALFIAVEHVLPKVQMALERTETAFVVMVIVTVCTSLDPESADETGTAVDCCTVLVAEM